MNVDIADLRAWPYLEAQKIYEHWTKYPSKDNICTFESGYGPSGLPHLGTFCEIKRISYVMNVFKNTYNVKTRLICFSDDLDALRKLPDNIPNIQQWKKYLGMPLSDIPDPFSQYSSFAEYMNNKMQAFLTKFNIKHIFYSATQCYKSGMFDSYLIKVLQRYDAIMDIMLPTLGKERQKTYSPFLPICKQTGQVLQVPMIDRSLADNTISYIDPNTNKVVTVKVTGGACKLQWKPDFGMRWAALDVRYEIYGKDHLPNGNLYSAICEALSKPAPVQYFFELFLDADGQKISKSKGNAIALEDLLKYFPTEVIEYFIFVNPKKAKRLSFDNILKYANEYMAAFASYFDLPAEKQKEHFLYHLYNQNVPRYNFGGINYSLLVYLISVTGTYDINTIKNLVTNYTQDIDLTEGSYFDSLIHHAVAYYRDFIKQYQNKREPTSEYKEILVKISDHIKSCATIHSITMQEYLYSLARHYYPDDMRNYFKSLYQILIGTEHGPRLGTLFAILGKEKALLLIESVLHDCSG